MKIELSKWGNSAGIRIPKQVLTQLGMTIGDSFDLFRGGDGCICLMPTKDGHRKVSPAQGISFSKLFEGFSACEPTQPWPTDDMVGAEKEAWR